MAMLPTFSLEYQRTPKQRVAEGVRYQQPRTLYVETMNIVLQELDFLGGQLYCLPGRIKVELLTKLCRRNALRIDLFSQLCTDSVKRIDFSSVGYVDDEMLAQVAKCTQLQDLDLHLAINNEKERTVTSDQLQKVFTACRRLQLVNLSSCVLVDDDAVQCLARSCPGLTTLVLTGCRLVTDSSLESLGDSARHLENLALNYTAITDVGVTALLKGPCAERLLDLRLSYCEGVTDDAIETVMSRAPRIRTLLFHFCPLITAASREHIGQTTLRNLSFTVSV